MPAPPLCPHCGAKLFPHEVTNDECAACGGRLSLAAAWAAPAGGGWGDPGPPAAESPPPLPIENRPLTLPDRPPPEAFATIRQGLHLVRWGVGLSVGLAALACIGPFVAAGGFAANRDGARLMAALGLSGGVFQVLSGLAIFVGVCLCCAVPKGCGAAKWARFLVPCLLLVVFLGLVAAAGLVASFDRGGGRPPAWLPVAGLAAAALVGVLLLGSLCYFLLLASLARFFDEHRLATGLTTYFTVAVVACLVAAVGGCVVFAIAASEHSFSSTAPLLLPAAASCVGLAIAVALSVWLLVLLTRLLRLIPVPQEPGRPFLPGL